MITCSAGRPRKVVIAFITALVATLAILIAPAASAQTEPAKPSLAERGKYLTDAGNCLSCHTRRDGRPFAGGVPFATPFGTIYSSNITPDAATGIGNWTKEDLRAAMRRGIGKGEEHLFPAFPYPSFTKVTDEDVDAIYAYLRTLPAVRYTPPGNGMLFSMRWPMSPWNSLYFQEGVYRPDPARAAEWNRGAYLVQGLGHCGACHTPRNWMMAENSAQSLSGGTLQSEVIQGKTGRWSAVNLTSAKSGLASWSVNDLAKYLQTGFCARAGAFGPMNEVIINSLAKLSKDDIHAMAFYLKSLPATEPTADAVSAGQAQGGATIYKERCEKCHSSSGRGGMFSGPPVAGSAVVQAEDPSSLINVILFGPQISKDIPTGSWETMQAYRDVLTDAQIAAVANFMRGSWGNRAGPVGERDVTQQR
jgi:alcohol dehydrogenase (quinone), cytochrome c subunit